MIRDSTLPLEDNEKRHILTQFVATQLLWKFGPEKDHLAKVVIQAVESSGYEDIPDDGFDHASDPIGIYTVDGGTRDDSMSLDGVILSGHVASDVLGIVYIEIGANVVLSCEYIHDDIKKYLKENKITCLDRVSYEEMTRVAVATGCTTVSLAPYVIKYLKYKVFGTCECFVDQEVGTQLYKQFSGCPVKTSCIVLRGDQQFLLEAQEILPEVIIFLRRAMKNYVFVESGGRIYAKVGDGLMNEDYEVGKAFGKALKALAQNLLDNGGFDLNGLLNKPSEVDNGGTADSFASHFPYEPAVVKIDAICDATQLACSMLTDEKGNATFRV